MAGSLNTLSPQSFLKFGDLLRYLRERAELTQREFASQVGYHYSYVSRIEKNEYIPDSATLVGRFVPALGLEDEPKWTERLLRLAASRAKTTAYAKGTWIPASSAPIADTTLPNFESSLNPLPANLAPLLGRENETDQLTALLSQTDVRLVTLIGPPGVGKTRLAVEVAEYMAGSFAHGAAFIDLTAVSDAKGFLPALTNALGLSEASDMPPIARVINFLRQKNLLLVVDNFEHILEASSQLVQILSVSPQIKALVTSREALHIPGENQFNVEPLLLPMASSDTLKDAPAIQLFVQRAQAVQAGFQLNDENLNVVAEICRRLDGLPLAIELAAPRIRILNPNAMLAQFDRRLDWAAHGSRDSQASRQTLRGALEWSYNMLPETRQILLLRLSVFSGGWTLESAEAFCADPETSDSPSAVRREEIFELMMSLVDQSLLVAETTERETRFRFLETIHAFAREKLRQSAEEIEMKNRHLAYFAAFAEEVETQVEGSEQIMWIRRADQEISNIRAALDWGLHPNAPLRDGLRLAGAISLYWIGRSYFREGYERLNTYLQRIDDPAHERLKTKILYRLGALAGYCLNYPLACQLCQQAVDLAWALDEIYYLASANYYLGEFAVLLGQREQSQRALEECIAICRAENFLPQLTLALNKLGYILAIEGERDRARATLAEAITLAEKHNDTWGICMALLSLGNVHRLWGNYDEAIDCLTRCLETAIPYGDRSAEGTACSTLSVLHNLKNEYAKSGEYAGRAFAVFQNIGDEVQQPLPLRMMGYAAIQAGNFVRARVLIRESLRGHRGLEDIPGQLACVVANAKCCFAEKDVKRAVSLCALIKRRIDADDVKLPEPDMKELQEVLQQGKRKLSKAAYESAYQEGQKLNLENTLMQLMEE